MMDSASTSLSFSGAPAVARGVSRLFLRNQIMVQPEVSLRNNRRADLMGLIPTCNDHNPLAHLRCPMVIMRQG